jgi:uncharacterized LabA/DUF88 family protein
MRTHVYIDGFNFYYGCVKGTPFKWLNLVEFCHLLLPSNDIRAVKYFTARVDSRPGDPDQATRQEMYFRALRTLSTVEIILGHFQSNPAWLPLADGSSFAKVLRTEEKGSDVNLAAHLIHDAHRGVIDCAVVVSNDSDLAEPMRIVRDELSLVVGLISPTTKKDRHPSQQLTKYATFIKSVRASALRKSQFAVTLKDINGTITKPKDW